MAKIQEYFAPTEKLTPSDLGDTAWTGAGRRIAPAYNEGAHFLEKSGAQYSQAAAGAEQSAKLNNALLDQYKLMAAVYPGLESPEGRVKEPAVRGGGGGGVRVAGGGGGSYSPNREISNAAADLTDWAQTYNNGGLLHNKYEGAKNQGGVLYDAYTGKPVDPNSLTHGAPVPGTGGTQYRTDPISGRQIPYSQQQWTPMGPNVDEGGNDFNGSPDNNVRTTARWNEGATGYHQDPTTGNWVPDPAKTQDQQFGPYQPTNPTPDPGSSSSWDIVGGVQNIINAISGFNAAGTPDAGVVPGDVVDQAAGTGAS